MSPATARSGFEAGGWQRPVPVPPRTDLRVLPPQPFRAPRGPFALVVGGLLTLGLLGVLLLNTVVAQDAFAVTALQHKSALLADEEQALTQQVAEVESPQRLESRARALGMVANVNPVFLRLADGKVLGEPVAGKAVRRAAAPAATTPAAGTPATGASTSNPVKPVTPTALRTKAAAPPKQPVAIKTKAARARAER